MNELKDLIEECEDFKLYYTFTGIWEPFKEKVQKCKVRVVELGKGEFDTMEFILLNPETNEAIRV